jgi:hypothetical protein
MFRIVMVLLLITLVGPSAIGAWASGSPTNAYTFRALSPSTAQAFSVGGIEFALQKGDNATPIDPNTRFAFGPRHIWAFWSWDDGKKGARVNYVLKFGATDVIWGTLSADDKNGRMEVDLHRLDELPLDLGVYRLVLDASGTESGNIREATFEIYDPDAGNGNSNNNGNHNNNNNNNSNSNNNNNSNGNSNNNNNNNSNGNSNNNNNNNANDNNDND